MRTLLVTVILIVGITFATNSQTKYQHIKISKDIEVVQISPHVFVHVSYGDMGKWGRVGCNGLIYTHNGEALLFDTPVNDSLTKQLVNWITDSLRARIIGFVPNHWHVDCMGGLKYIHSIGIPSYANEKTIKIAKAKKLPIPQHGFRDSLTLHLGNDVAVCKYFGAAHTVDNIVTWLPSEKILFGGCMVKEIASKTLGNTADANLSEWPKTMGRVIAAYSSAKIVVPGHGAFGGVELLKHTHDLLSKPE